MEENNNILYFYSYNVLEKRIEEYKVKVETEKNNYRCINYKFPICGLKNINRKKEYVVCYKPYEYYFFAVNKLDISVITMHFIEYFRSQANKNMLMLKEIRDIDTIFIES